MLRNFDRGPARDELANRLEPAVVRRDVQCRVALRAQSIGVRARFEQQPDRVRGSAITRLAEDSDLAFANVARPSVH